MRISDFLVPNDASFCFRLCTSFGPVSSFAFWPKLMLLCAHQIKFTCHQKTHFNHIMITLFDHFWSYAFKVCLLMHDIPNGNSHTGAHLDLPICSPSSHQTLHHGLCIGLIGVVIQKFGRVETVQLLQPFFTINSVHVCHWAIHPNPFEPTNNMTTCSRGDKMPKNRKIKKLYLYLGQSIIISHKLKC